MKSRHESRHDGGITEKQARPRTYPATAGRGSRMPRDRRLRTVLRPHLRTSDGRVHEFALRQGADVSTQGFS